ncbi:uncharacterized protein LOC144344249 [Saccoglossus kowalevskii]
MAGTQSCTTKTRSAAPQVGGRSYKQTTGRMRGPRENDASTGEKTETRKAESLLPSRLEKKGGGRTLNGDITPHSLQGEMEKSAMSMYTATSDQGLVSPSTPVALRLQKCIPRWKETINDPYVISIITHRYRILLIKEPKCKKRTCISGTPGSTQSTILKESVEILLKKKVIQRVQNPKNSFISRLFPVKKSNGGYRLVLDLKELNKFVKKETFKMLTPALVRASIQKGDWMTSLDLTDAYLHIPIHTESRRLLRFVVNGVTYQYTVLPFGLTSAPLLFTKVLRTVVALLHKNAADVNPYLDDWLIKSQNRNLICQSTERTVSLLLKLGFLINMEKSELIPTQKIVFLGMELDAEKGMIRPAQHRIDNVQNMIQSFLKQKQATLRQVMRLVGMLTSMRGLVPRAALQSRPIQRLVLDAQLKMQLSKDWIKYEKPILFTPAFLESLPWWGNLKNLTAGIPMDKAKPTVTLVTDASMTGWGGHCMDGIAHGQWNEKQRKFHINRLEMLAVQFSLQSFKKAVKNRAVLIRSDNQTVVAYLNKEGGTKSVVKRPCCSSAKVVCTKQSRADVQTYTGSPKRCSGLAIPGETLRRHRMGAVTDGSKPSVRHVGGTPGRSVCNTGKQKTSRFCDALSGQTVTDVGGTSDGVGRNVQLRIPTISIDPPNVTKTGTIGELAHDSSGTELAVSDLVSVTAVSANGPSEKPATRNRVDTTRQLYTNQPGAVPTSRVETIQQFRIAQGFSSQVSQTTTAGLRDSSNGLYQYHWENFVIGVLAGIYIHSILFAQVAEFFSYLINEKKLKPGTVENYKSAINSVLKLSLDKNISDDPTISDLFKGFITQAGPIERYKAPAWSLSVVLEALRQFPYEPKELASLQDWTKKTVFLLALASGRRVSEIHALSFEDNFTVFYPDKAILMTSVKFRGKNQKLHETATPIVIPALSNISNEKQDRILCPVRALAYYKKRTSGVRRGQRSMFVCYQKGKQSSAASKFTLARWVKETVYHAYSDKYLSTEAGKVTAKMHDLRGIGNTLAFASGASLAQVLAAGSWKTSNTFLSYYLKDLAAESQGLHSLGYLVTGQVVTKQ